MIKPAFVDLDLDGDLDLVIGHDDGDLFYFERNASGGLVPREGAGSNPFDSINVGMKSAPAFGDWDLDGDLDLVIGSESGELHYYEQVASNSWEKRSNGSNPFDGIKVKLYAAPALVDWDSDNDLDLVLGSYDEGLSYFEQVAPNILKERSSQSSNPFFSITKATYSVPAFVDWDADGDLDLVLGNEYGQLSYFERVAPDTLYPLVGAGSNPFEGIKVSGHSAPAFVDWDSDGGLDLVIGKLSPGMDYYGRVALETLKLLSGEGVSPFDSIDVGTNKYSAPVFVDWDMDGDTDLVIGSADPDFGFDQSLIYFEQDASGALRRQTGKGTDPFRGIKLGNYPKPAFVDWDSDGDWDLVVGSEKGDLSYYEQVAVNTLEQRKGAGSNPFDGIEVKRSAAPAFVDWDSDGDLDLVIGSKEGILYYYEQVANNTLEQHLGAVSNPFDGISVGKFSTPAFVDWDSDGDLDLVVGATKNTKGVVSYFERVGPNKLEKHGSSPFDRISIEADPTPAFVDWDSDGRMDLVIGSYFGPLAYFERGGCQQAGACYGKGFCSQSGTCSCLTGYSGSNCAVCASGFFTIRSGPHRTCVECPSSNESRICSDRGACSDDAKVDTSGLTSTKGMLAVGSGGCTCSAWFFGTLCESGLCPAGSEEVPPPDRGPNVCSECPAGRYSVGLGEACEDCQAGRYSNPGHGYSADQESPCHACPAGWHSEKASADCFVDGILWTVLVAVTFMQLVGWLPVFLSVRRSIRILDVRTFEEKVTVTTQGPHGISSGHMPNMLVAGTGTRVLGNSDGLRVGVQVVDPVRIELHGVQGVQMGAEASMGTLTPQFPHELVHTNVADTGISPLALCCVLATFAVVLSVATSLTLLDRHPETTATMLGAAHPVGILIALSAAALWRWRVARSRTKLAVRLDHFRRKLLFANPNPQPNGRGPQRAVPAGKLAALYEEFEDFIQSRNAYYLNANITLPLTKPFRLSFAELAGPQVLTFFVSHFWGTPFKHFVAAIRKHAEHAVLTLPAEYQAQDWRSLAYWVCFLSNNQWKVIEELGGDDWQASSFYMALRHVSCRATCMVLDRVAKPLERSWCLFEVLQTFKLQHSSNDGAPDAEKSGFEGLLFCTAEGIIGEDDCFDTALALASKLTELSVKNASATSAHDQKMIMDLVEEEEKQTNTTMDAFIRINMRSTLQKAQDRFDMKAQALRTSLDRLSHREVQNSNCQVGDGVL